jgi:hypothetical protein
MLLMVSAAVPVLLSLTVCEALLVPTVCPLKVRLPGETPATGAVPVPVRPIVCMLPGIPLLLSVMVTEPVSVPVAVGVNVTSIVQVALEATVPPV